MLPTPSTSHVPFSNVYEPAEDSFLFLDTLSSASEVEFLSQRFDGSHCVSPLVLEVGPGSGVVLSFIAANAHYLFGRRDILTLGVDVNLFACRATCKTVERNLSDASASPKPWASTFVGCVNGDLTGALRPGCVDVLVFNPPYVPSESIPTFVGDEPELQENMPDGEAQFQRDSNLLAIATDGGDDGMQVTWRLLEELKLTLNPDRGVAYILLCAQNNPELVKNQIAAWGSAWSVQTVGSSGKKGGWEKLQIIRITKNRAAAAA